MEKFSNEVNDYLCRYYNYIIINNLLDKYTKLEAIRIAERVLSGIASGSEAMQEKFVNNWDAIAELFNNTPIHEFKIQHTIYNGEEYVNTIGTFEIKGYSQKKIEDDLRHVLFNLYKPKIIGETFGIVI